VPEFPDVELYRSAIASRIIGARLSAFQIAAPHLLASVETPPEALIGRPATGVRRIGKQVVMKFDEQHFCAVHLAVAGRFHWTAGAGSGKPVRLSPRGNLAVWTFESGPAGGGHLRLVERSPKKRASIRVGRGEAAFRKLDRGGLEVPGSTPAAFRARLDGVTNTIKRALTEPARFAGIGNAYSDEILHRAGLAPSKRAGSLTAEEVGRLHTAAESVLTEWAARLQEECGSSFPTGVTAFREGMAVHGRFGQPCPVCGSPVQRVRRAENEFNYCATCQTGGRLLADRAMSRLLRKKWPRTLKAAEARRQRLGTRESGSSPPNDRDPQ
jgi:formamidopyrimidine-DNA glycosylase